MERWGQIRQRNEGYRIKYLQQIFQSIKDIKMGSLEKNFVLQFDKPNTEIANVNAKYFFLKSTPKIIIELILISFCCSAILLLVFSNFGLVYEPAVKLAIVSGYVVNLRPNSLLS